MSIKSLYHTDLTSMLIAIVRAALAERPGADDKEKFRVAISRHQVERLRLVYEFCIYENPETNSFVLAFRKSENFRRRAPKDE